MKKTDISKGHKRRARWIAAVALGVFSLAAQSGGVGLSGHQGGEGYSDRKSVV